MLSPSLAIDLARQGSFLPAQSANILFLAGPQPARLRPTYRFVSFVSLHAFTVSFPFVLKCVSFVFVFVLPHFIDWFRFVSCPYRFVSFCFTVLSLSFRFMAFSFRPFGFDRFVPFRVSGCFSNQVPFYTLVLTCSSAHTQGKSSIMVVHS